MTFKSDVKSQYILWHLDYIKNIKIAYSVCSFSTFFKRFYFLFKLFLDQMKFWCVLYEKQY